MTIKQHIELMLNKMLAVNTNEYYATLLFDIINKECGTNITSNDLVITSTAEHCTLPNSYNTVSNILTMSKEFTNYSTNKRKFFIVFLGSLIPLDNTDYPRGFFYNSSSNSIKKHPFWKKKLRKYFPFILPAISQDRIPCLDQFNLGQDKSMKFIIEYLKKNNTLPYRKQICNINTYLYNNLLKEGLNSPKILFLSLEDVVLKFLKLLIKNKDKVVETFIFSNFQKTYDALFDVPTCWNADKGSFLFWYEQGSKLLPLKFSKQFFSNNNIKIPITRDCIINNLQNKKFYPTGFVSLLLINMTTNLPTIGGKRQGVYLNKMIEYFNSYSEFYTTQNINQVNWGIHPSIGKYLTPSMEEVSGIYLLSNPPTKEQYESYILNEKIKC